MKLAELREALIDEKVPLSAIMRRVKVLAFRLNSREFLSWTEKEINGYVWERDKDEFPNYRIIETYSLGDFSGYAGTQSRNMPIPTVGLPLELQEYATKHYVCEGVRALESLVEQCEEGTLKAPWPANTIAAISDKIYEHMNCVTAWKTVNKAKLEQILDTVRNRLLDFTLRVEQAFPDLGAEDLPNDMDSVQKVTNIFKITIFGDSNVVMAGAGSRQSVLKQGHGISVASVLQGDNRKTGLERQHVKTGLLARLISGLGKFLSAIGLGMVRKWFGI